MEAAVESTPEEAMEGSAQPPLHRRIEFHLARRPYTGVPLSSGDFCLETLNPESSDKRLAMAEAGSGDGTLSGDSAARGKRSAGGEFHERGLDPELSFRISFQKIGAGLENLGNTCYLNSVLQCLTYTEPFAAYLQSGKHKSTCRAAGFCAMCALQNHVMDALQSSGKILKPFHLVRNLRCISRTFRNSRQEDAHEYMVNLLESMHKCCLPYGVPSESPSAYEKSLVHKIFGGQLRSQVKCMKCSYCSNKFDPFLDLSLEIVGADSLRKALVYFTAMEQLDDGERQYYCQHCKEKVKAFKQLTIHKAPYVLSIHLKRFGSCIRGEKINKKVDFGPTLDLKPFVSGLDEEDLKYTLYGVLVHAGWSTHSGHYFCYVRTSAGLWYSLDDNHVSQVSEKTVLSREAYMLFYVRDAKTIKRPLEVNLKTDTSTNSTGDRGTLLMERNLHTLDYTSSKVRNDGVFHGLPLSLVESPGKHLIKNQEPLVQSNGHATTKGSCFQLSEDILSNGLHKEMLPLYKTEILASVNSNVPSFGAKKCNVAQHVTKQNMGTSYILDSDDKRTLGSSSTINDPIKQAASARFMDDGGDYSNKKECSTSQQCQNGTKSFLKLLEHPTVSSLQVESSAVLEIENLMNGSPKKGVLSKKSKVSLPKGYCFGRKQLFMMSINLRKNCKKKTRKQHHSCRNKIKKRILNLYIDSQGASTSEACRPVELYSTHSFEKDLHTTSGKKSKSDKDVKSGNGFCQMNNIETQENCSSGDLAVPSKEPIRSLGSTIESLGEKCKNGNDKDILQSCPMSLLKASLKEATVAKWDDVDLASSQINELEDGPKRKIGYLLDEWDEEYDRGKRKKLKPRKQHFDGRNPFQETAELKALEKSKRIAQF